MRQLVYVLSALAISGCGDERIAVETSAVKEPISAVSDAALARCSNGQNAVADALEGSDSDTVVLAIDRTIADCRSASFKLRNTEIDGLDTVAAAGAIDQMIDGLTEVRKGVELMDRSPSQARTTAQSGMTRYKVGVERLNATTR